MPALGRPQGPPLRRDERGQLEEFPHAGVHHFAPPSDQRLPRNFVVHIELGFSSPEKVLDERRDVSRVHLAGVIRDARSQDDLSNDGHVW